MSDFKTKTPTIEEMLEAGLHFGHPVRRKHPLMDEYVYAVEKKNSIIDLYQTEEKFKKALDFLYEIAKSGKQIIIVGTKRQAADKVADAARSAGALFVNERWLGGTLTNFNSVKGNCDTLKELEEGLKTNRFDKYTKKEKLLIARRIEKLETLVGGIREIRKYPAAVVVIDPKREKTVLREAKALNIPVVALIDTNSDPRMVDFPVPGNDDAMKAIGMFLDVVSAVIAEGYAAQPKDEAKEVKPAQTQAVKAEVTTPKVEVKPVKAKVEKAEKAEPKKSEKPAAKKSTAKKAAK
jgi:small subunit ribosomal protein S2